MKQSGRFMIFVLVVTLTLAAAGQKAVGAEGPAKVHLQTLEGTQSFPLAVLSDKIARKHNIEVVLEKGAGPVGIYTKMKTGDFEVAFGAWLTISIFRSRGLKMKQIYSMNDMSTNRPMVPKNSSIRNYGDLKGKRVGLFAGPTATTTFMFRTLAKKFHGYDPLKEAKLRFGAPPLLWGMLGKGELDAIITLEPFNTKMLETGKFRALPSLGKTWLDRTGQRVLLLTVVANEEWLNQNEDTARRFVKAFKESLEFVRDHPEVWPEIAKKLGVKTAEGRKALYRRVAPAYVMRWDKAYVDEQIKWADTVRKTFGGNIRGIPKKIPEDVWSFKYAP